MKKDGIRMRKEMSESDEEEEKKSGEASEKGLKGLCVGVSAVFTPTVFVW